MKFGAVAPIQDEKARHLMPLLMPISRQVPICRRGFFGTAYLARQKPALQQAVSSSRFNKLADFCQIEARWECELPLFRVKEEDAPCNRQGIDWDRP